VRFVGDTANSVTTGFGLGLRAGEVGFQIGNLVDVKPPRGALFPIPAI
jgi:hypothetical protein